MRSDRLLPVFALITVLADCSSRSDAGLARLPQDSSGGAATPVEIAVAKVQRQSINLPVIASGTTDPVRAADIGPQLTARIAEVLVQEGDRVELGQPLVRLDMRDASLRAAQALAGAASAGIQAQLAESEFQRLAPLAQRGTIPTRQAEQLEAQRDALASAARAADAMAAQARRGVAEAIVRAPFAGIVSLVLAEVGEVATMMPPTILVRLVDLSEVEVSVRVHERELARIASGDAVEVELPNLRRSGSGRVTFISPEIDPRSRTAGVTARIPNPDGTLRAGAFAELRIVPTESHEGLVVPRDAIVAEGDDAAVFVVVDGRVQRRPVDIQRIDDEQVEIVAGLREGETIATSMADRLAEGAQVRLATAVPGEAR